MHETPESAAAEIPPDDDFPALGATTYSELMGIARSQLGRGNLISLDAPSIVHEAYLRLANRGVLKLAERGKFYPE